jgi:hypothetical protein
MGEGTREEASAFVRRGGSTPLDAMTTPEGLAQERLACGLHFSYLTVQSRWRIPELICRIEHYLTRRKTTSGANLCFLCLVLREIPTVPGECPIPPVG